MAEMMKDTPMYKSYVAVAPKPAEFPKLLDRMGALMRKPYNWAEDVKTLKMPVMLVYGDSDMFRPEHIVEFYQLLGGGLKDAGWMREHMSKNRLAILPDLTHYEMFAAPVLAQHRAARSSTARAARRAGPNRCSSKGSSRRFSQTKDARARYRTRAFAFVRGDLADLLYSQGYSLRGHSD